MRHFFVRAAFDDDKLFKDFFDCLVSNKLLAPKEIQQFVKLKDVIALYAMTYMHECVINLDDGTIATLSASPDCGTGTIGIFAKAEVTTQGKNVFIAAPIFTTKIRAVDCCEPSLLNLNTAVWECHLELTPNRTLARLGTIIIPHRPG
jgi:hypothetical protein